VSLPEFLAVLFESGRVRVSPTREPLSKNELREVDDILATWERHLRDEFAGEAPMLLVPAARWAASALHRACQLTVYRDQAVGPFVSLDDAVPEMAGQAYPVQVHYSVDLVFRFLPDLERLARGVARQDPLLEQIGLWAQAWPLSSVGMKSVVPQHVDTLLEHAGMLRYYADRVIARRDVSRLSHPRVRDAVRHALGLYDDLAPELAAALREPVPEAFDTRAEPT
jgi:hypothetical protein